MPDKQVNIFETAAKVKSQIEAHPKEEHAKVLRWVAESLGISMGVPAGAGGATASTQTAAGGAAASTSAAHQLPQGGVTHRAKDIRSFVQEKQPKSDNQYAAVVAYYYRFEAPEAERAESINTEMLQESTRLAGRTRLGDPNKTLRNAVQQGYLDVTDRGRYRVSTVGENLVAMTLPGGDSSNTVRRTRQSGKKKTSRKTR